LTGPREFSGALLEEGIAIQESGWYSPMRYDAAQLQANREETSVSEHFAEAGYEVFVVRSEKPIAWVSMDRRLGGRLLDKRLGWATDSAGLLQPRPQSADSRAGFVSAQ
jgi:hypothetical protein